MMDDATVSATKDDNEFLEELRRVLDYNPETGELTWKVTQNWKSKAGSTAGNVNSKGRIQIRFRSRLYYAHRLVWLLTYGKWPEQTVDHLDGDKSNNRIENLRDVSNGVNQQNQRKPRSSSKSGILGVHWHDRDQKFVAKIGINGKNKHLGYFLTAEEAHAAYLAAKRKFHEGCTI